jgi:hypothetical protein
LQPVAASSFGLAQVGVLCIDAARWQPEKGSEKAIGQGSMLERSPERRIKSPF